MNLATDRSLTHRIASVAILMLVASLWMSPANVFSLLVPFSSAPGAEYYVRAIMAGLVNAAWSMVFVVVVAQLPKAVHAVVFSVLALWLTVFATATAVHVGIYGQLIGAPSLLAIFDTSRGEMSEFAAIYASVHTGLALAATAAIWLTLGYFLRKRLQPVLGGLKWPLVAALVALLLAMSSTGWDRLAFANNNPVLFVYKVGGRAFATRSYFQNINPDEVQKVNARLKAPASERQTHVLIIGESLTPTHMSLYGYPRKTTPHLEKMTGWDMVALKDVCSEQPMTQLSIAELMTGLPADDIIQAANRPNLLSILKEVDFKTFWITNQIGLGSEYALGDLWSLYAHESKFLNKRDFGEGYDFDEVLLPALKDALADTAPRKFIVLHMMGSHGKYGQRYPQSFKKWTGNADIPAHVPRRGSEGFNAQEYNDYDNSVLYTDHILNEILAISAQQGVSSVVYLSDHGQNIGEFSELVGHSTTNGPRQGFEVPYLYFFSADHASAIRPQLETLKGNAAHPYSSRHSLYTLLDVYRVEAPLSGPRLTASYEGTTRYCDSLPRPTLAQ